jgi:hypothetical protein
MVAGRIRWLRALLVAPVLVFALGASSHAAVRCTLTGLLVPESCCPDVADPAPSQPSIGDPGCCERVTIASARIPAAGPQSLRARPTEPTLSRAIPLPAFVAERTARQPLAQRRADRPPGSSPPLYVLSHAFLI